MDMADNRWAKLIDLHVQVVDDKNCRAAYHKDEDPQGII